jgi:hypothetical protein
LSLREVVDLSVDIDLSSLTPCEIEGAFRSLCGAMLLRAAQELGVNPQLTKRAIDARRTTRAWLFQDLGLITFVEACQACTIDRRYFLDNVVEAAERASVRQGGGERWVFGRHITESATA